MTKKLTRKLLSVVLSVLLVFGGTPMSELIGLDFSDFNVFAVKAEAFTTTYKDGYITYSLSENSAMVYSCDEAASGNIVIPDTINERTVNEIKYSAFSGCNNITSVTIPGGVKTIGNSAFAHCSSLESVTIEYGVTNIEMGAFWDCPSLTNVTLPESLTSIKTCLFDGCIGLKSITIPASVKYISDDAFGDCSGLENIYVADGNSNYYDDNGVLFSNKFNYIGDDGIAVSNSYNCIALCPAKKSGSYNIPDGIEKIGSRAFQDCINLTSITIPKTVKEIDDVAFCNCNKLTSLVIPDSVVYIGMHAFEDCSSLTDVSLSDNITSLSLDIFANCSNLKSVTIPNSVTVIGSDAFNNCSSLTSITIPDSVKHIYDEAFEGCSSLESVKLSNNITSIYNRTFYGCAKLKSITIPYGVTSIGKLAFAYCTGLTEVTIPNSVTEIQQTAFGGCESLSSVVIPNSVEQLGEEAFCLCYGLTSATLGSGLKTIGANAFSECTGLKNITIPGSVTSIGKEAFMFCYELNSVTFNEGLKSIGDNAFGICVSLESISIPDSVTYLGEGVFTGCTKLKDAKLPKNMTDCPGGLFAGCLSLETVTFSKTLESIGESAFNMCLSLKTLDLPSSVVSIGVGAFTYTSINKLTIGENIKSIGEDAFLLADDTLKEVKIYSKNVELSEASIGYYCKELSQFIKDNSLETFIDLYTELLILTFKNELTEEDEARAEEIQNALIEAYGVGGVIENFTIHGYTDSTAQTYANDNNFKFVPFGDEEVCDHDIEHITVPSSCTVAGVEYDYCYNCEEVFNYHTLSLAEHSYSVWKTVKGATALAYGEKVRTCTVCGHEQTQVIDKIPSTESKDEASGISVIYPDESYDQTIQVAVSEIFDGASYQILNSEKGNRQNCLFDITTFINGQKVQPKSFVWVKIPLPENYNPETTYVYYITNMGTLEKMNSFVQDGYIYFEAAHFSYYAIVDESSTTSSTYPFTSCDCICHESGFSGFIYKLMRILWKLLKINKICGCGMAHY